MSLLPLRQRAEARLRESAPDELTPLEMKALVHELRVHQIELELQNEDLRQTQAALEESRRQYIDLYDFAPVGYCSLEKDGTIRAINLTATRQVGAGRADILDTRLYQYVVEEDRDILFAHLREVFATECHQTCELRLLKADGTHVDAQLESEVRSSRFSGLRRSAEALTTNVRRRAEAATTNLNPEEAAEAATTNLCRTTIIDITERKQRERLQKRCEEHEVLLKEVYHRVKNNFQSIGSLLRLKASTCQHAEARNVLHDCAARVHSMAAVHTHFYQSDTLAAIEFGNSVNEIVKDLYHVYHVNIDRIKLEIKCERVWLSMKKAILCAMLVNELVSNTFKYAFPDGRSGTLRLNLHAREGQVVLVVSDDGVGIPPAVDHEQTSSLGLLLVRDFAKQLQGTLELDRRAGTRFTLKFPDSRGS